MNKEILPFFINHSSSYILEVINSQYIVQTLLSFNDGIPPKYTQEECISQVNYVNDQIRKHAPSLKNYTFHEVLKHLTVKEKTTTKKVFFTKSGETYLVNKFFTEGIQRVAPNEVHIYNTIKYLDVFIAKDETRHYPLRSVLISQSEFYHKRLQNKDDIKIYPNFSYLVISPCKTIFEKRVEPYDGSGTSADGYRASKRQKIEVEVHDNVNLQGEILPHLPVNRSIDVNEGHHPGDSFYETISEIGTVCYGGPGSRSQLSSTRSPGVVFQEQESRQTPGWIRSTAEDDSETFPTVAGQNLFAIRKDQQIESYVLCSGSTLRMQTNGTLSGEFKIENDDMDPKCFHYHIKGNEMVETASFQNGSQFKTPLPISDELVQQLRETGNRREKVIVKYFFSSVLKKIEALHKSYVDMKNVGMIGSCVPAIVHLNDSKFCGSIPDAYMKI